MRLHRQVPINLNRGRYWVFINFNSRSPYFLLKHSISPSLNLWFLLEIINYKPSTFDNVSPQLKCPSDFPLRPLLLLLSRFWGRLSWESNNTEWKCLKEELLTWRCRRIKTESELGMEILTLCEISWKFGTAIQLNLIETEHSHSAKRASGADRFANKTDRQSLTKRRADSQQPRNRKVVVYGRRSRGCQPAQREKAFAKIKGRHFS